MIQFNKKDCGGLKMLTPEQKAEREKITENFTIFTPEDNKPYVFISYKSDDYKEVLGNIVYSLINEYGLRIYFDNDFLDQNHNWLKCMKNAMNVSNCRAIIPFISNNYIRSLACFTELMYAKSEDIDIMNEELKIIPFTLDEIESDRNSSYIKPDTNEENIIVEIIDLFINGEFFEKQANQKFKKQIEKLKKSYVAGQLTYDFMQTCMIALCHQVNENILKNETGKGFIKHLYERIKKAVSEDVFDESLIGSLDKAKTYVKPTVSAPAVTQAEPIKELTSEPLKLAPVVEKPIEVKAAPVAPNMVFSIGSAATYKLAEKLGKYCAVIEVIGDTYKLLKGSKIAAYDVPSARGAIKIRAEKSEPYCEYRIVKEDIVASSSSIASVITGLSKSGPDFMKSVKDVKPDDIGRYLEQKNEAVTVADTVALLLCCYISKYSDEAYLKLGCKNGNETFEKISKITGKPHNTVRQRRDSFDWYIDNHRRGWEDKNGSFYRKHSELIDKMNSFKDINQATEHVKNELIKFGYTDILKD